MDYNNLLQSNSCLIQQMFRNIEAETMECYEMIYKLI